MRSLNIPLEFGTFILEGPCIYLKIMTIIQAKKLTFRKTKKIFFLSVIYLTTAFSIQFTTQEPVRAEPISKQAFAGGLFSGCAKNKSRETCLCYAKAVVTRYNKLQLDAMYRQMKIEPESRKMFFLVHATEMNQCMAQTKQ